MLTQLVKDWIEAGDFSDPRENSRLEQAHWQQVRKCDVTLTDSETTT